jgi:site-specific DNA-adenine methylase
MATNTPDQKGSQQPVQQEVSRFRLPEFVLMPDFLSITGSTVYGDKKPEDVDCVIRCEQDSKGLLLRIPEAIAMKLLRALKQGFGRDGHLVPSLSGPNWSYAPIADLVIRPKKPEMRRLDEELITAKSIEGEMEQSREEDRIAPLRAFYVIKPIRPIQPEERMSLESLCSLYEKERSSALAKGLIVEKKFDGAHCLLMLSAGKVRIVSEDGADVTSRFPSAAVAVRILSLRSATFDCEVEMWEEGKHHAREEVSAYMHRKAEADDSSIIFNVFGLLFLNGVDLHKKTEAERLELLDKIRFPQSTMEAPDCSKALNRTVSVVVKDGKALRQECLKATQASGSEGVVVKETGGDYPLTGGAVQSWVKFHKNAVLSGIVLRRVETATPSTYNYYYGLLPGKGEPGDPFKLDGESYLEVGKTFSTAKRLAPGAIMEIEFESLNLYRKGAKTYVGVWVPRFIREMEGKPDTVEQAVEKARKAGILVEKTEVKKAASVTALPPEDEKHKFVLQSHYRGQSVHLDLRLQKGDFLEGWTLMAAMPGAITEKVETLQQAKSFDSKPTTYKVDLSSGKFRERQVRGGAVRPASIMASEKAKHPLSWLDVEGVADVGKVGATRNFPGVFHVIDSGTVEFGAVKPYFREYFLHGKILKGRLLFRILSGAKAIKSQLLPPGVEEEHERTSFYWIAMQPVDETPYVLSNEAMKKGWLPPFGYSALPAEMRREVPVELAYWKMRGEKASRARKEVADRLRGEKGVRGVFGSAGGKFFLAGRIVSRIPKHKTYVEPFAGGAAVYFSKEPSEVEVISDLNPEIANAYAVLKEMTPEQKKELLSYDWQLSRSNFDRATKEAGKGSKLRQFWAWMIRVLSSYGGEIVRYQDREGSWKGVDRLDILHERLKSTHIAHADYKAVVKKWDAPDTFFYLDPPYKGEAKKILGIVPMVELARVCKAIKGKFILSCADSTENRSLLKCFSIQTIKRYSPLDYRKPVGTDIDRELLVSNFEMARKEGQSFTLRRRWWKGQEAIRFGPSTEIWDIQWDGTKFVLTGDPLSVEYNSGYMEKPDEKVMKDGETEDLKPGDPLNPTKKTSAFLEQIDSGGVLVLEDGADIKKVSFRGKVLKAEVIFSREEAGSEIWTVSRSAEVSAKSYFEFVRKEEDQQIVGGIVYPANEEDRQGDWTDFEANQKAMYYFMEHGEGFPLTHDGKLISCTILECFQAESAMKKGEGKLNPGDWWITVRINDKKVWEMVKEGRITGFSWEGICLPERVTGAEG